MGMTQEEKQLLLKDLCGRLPYRVMVDVFPYADPQFLCMIDPIRFEYRLDFGSNKNIFHRNLVGEEVSDIKPYLRPMSSMTKEEKDELKEEHKTDERIYAEVIKRIENGDELARGTAVPHFAVDWCNKYHFDYRGLIPIGLALEAPEGMYKSEEL